MTVSYGFYNSLGGDRKYNTNHISYLFDGLVRDGIFATYGQAFAVTAPGTSMTINVGVGRGWFDHTWTLNDAILPITVELSELIFDRIDALVLEVDTRSVSRKNTIKIIKGVGATVPLKPTLIKSEGLNQYPFAYITVKKGTSTITQANIENMIGKTECPFVVGILEHIDISMLIAQWEAEWDQWTVQQTADFQLWFDTIKGQLSEDAAGHLQNQINTLVGRMDRDYSPVILPITGWFTETAPFTIDSVYKYYYPYPIPGARIEDEATIKVTQETNDMGILSVENDTINGYVRIFANSIPTKQVTINRITLRRTNNV